MIITSDKMLMDFYNINHGSVIVKNINMMEINDSTKILILGSIEEPGFNHMFSKQFHIYKAIDENKLIKGKTKTTARKAFRAKEETIKNELYSILDKKLYKAGITMSSVFDKALFEIPTIKEKNIFMASINKELLKLKDRPDVKIITTSKLTYSTFMSIKESLDINNDVCLIPSNIEGTKIKNIFDKATLEIMWEKNLIDFSSWNKLTQGFLNNLTYHFDKDSNSSWFE